MNIKQINAKIKWIAATGAKLDTAIHETGVACMEHCLEHGDARPMDNLLKALPKGVRAEGFKVWVQTFSPIRWNGDGEVGVSKPEAKLFVPFNIPAATATPFYDLTDEKVKVKALTLEALKALIARTIAQIEAIDDNGEVHDKDGNLKAKVGEGENVVALKDYVAKIKLAA